MRKAGAQSTSAKPRQPNQPSAQPERQDPLLDYPMLLSVTDLAHITGFSVHTIRDWCEQGLLPAQKIGNRWRLERNRAILALKNLNRKRRSKRRGQDPA